jgi:divalent metal cation (Fe/Co/Zn/Cd) transporter
MKKILNRIEDPSELIFLAALFITALYFFIGSFGFTGNAWVYPMFTAAAVLICILVYTLKTFWAALQSAARTEKTAAERAENREDAKRIAITIVCFLGYIVLSYLFGFLIAAAVLGVAYPLIFKYRKVSSVVLCLITNIALVLLFQRALGVSLSHGILVDFTRLFF